MALRCQTDEPGAFEDLIAVMERPLLYYAASLTGDQDTWVRASVVLFICGATELSKHFINRSRAEVLKEVKQVQLQVLELQALLKRDESR